MQEQETRRIRKGRVRFIVIVLLLMASPLLACVPFAAATFEAVVVQEWAVSLVPVFPGNVIDMRTTSDPWEGSANKHYRVNDTSVAAVADFYEQELSRPPWLLYDQQRYRGAQGDDMYCASFERWSLGGRRLQLYSVLVLPARDVSGQPTGGVVVVLYTKRVPEDLPCRAPEGR